MADEPLVFEQTVEALFVRALGRRLTPECKSRLRQAGLDVDQKLKPAYSFTSWMTFVCIAAQELYPGLPVEEGAFKLGEAYIDGFRETMLGRAVLSLLRVLGPRRTLARATQNFRAGNNFTECRLKELGPTQFELWMNDVGSSPAFTAGIIHAGLRVAGAQDIRVEPSGYAGDACTYQLSWKEASLSPGVAAKADSRGDKRSGSIRPQ
ncbi:DUF2378 family protein [Hyalangium rubrum]|uniref:DUF2378 family protein n=1 Tax=Hyalangium rubrum TaxID=3103134 RepID=A0ABU5H6Y8_9BACT|nr:DUF2378 family protein [Hyalangium sp. s54d21]MDY7229235.1 DUF2378 family protein [Hyalangium sp. s54d21]